MSLPDPTSPPPTLRPTLSKMAVVSFLLALFLPALGSFLAMSLARRALFHIILSNGTLYGRRLANAAFIIAMCTFLLALLMTIVGLLFS